MIFCFFRIDSYHSQHCALKSYILHILATLHRKEKIISSTKVPVAVTQIHGGSEPASVDDIKKRGRQLCYSRNSDIIQQVVSG